MTGWRRVANSCTCCEPPDPDCTCTETHITALPVTCSAATVYDVTNLCTTDVTNCDGFTVTASGLMFIHFGCPWCEFNPPCCGGEACEASFSNVSTHHDCCASPNCFSNGDDEVGDDTPPDTCCEAGASVFLARGIQGEACEEPQKQFGTASLGSVFDAVTISYNAANAGSDVTDDLCEVWGYVNGTSAKVKYYYTTGVCKLYIFPVDQWTSAGDLITCINAQTTGSSVDDLGLTATGDSTKIMSWDASASIPRHSYIRLDESPSDTMPIKVYQPPECWFTYSCAIWVDGFPCEYEEGDYGGEWDFTITSDTKQRLTTTQSWVDYAECPYNYSWSVTSLGSGFEALSVSVDGD